MNKVTVFGSYVMDLTVLAPHVPIVGETVFSGPFKMGPGGKGFNQAVAAQKAGSEVVFMTKIGKDIFAPFVKNAFDRFKISKEYLLESETSKTGVALIVVNETNGNNAIAVAPEACNEILVEEVKNHEQIFKSCDVFLTQFEANLEATYEAIKIAKESGAIVILNPAPVKEFNREILDYVDILIPNEIEASLIADVPLDGMNSIYKIASELEDKVETVVITLGEKGVFCSNISEKVIPVIEVDTIDTTGAGDAFAGIFASYLSRGHSLRDAIDYARVGAAISTTRFGTSPSMPTKEEIESKYHEISRSEFV